MGENSIPVQLLSPSTRDNPYPINQAVTNYFIDHIEENIVVGLDKLFMTEKKESTFYKVMENCPFLTKEKLGFIFKKTSL